MTQQKTQDLSADYESAESQGEFGGPSIENPKKKKPPRKFKFFLWLIKAILTIVIGNFIIFGIGFLIMVITDELSYSPTPYDEEKMKFYEIAVFKLYFKADGVVHTQITTNVSPAISMDPPGRREYTESALWKNLDTVYLYHPKESSYSYNSSLAERSYTFTGEREDLYEINLKLKSLRFKDGQVFYNPKARKKSDGALFGHSSMQYEASGSQHSRDWIIAFKFTDRWYYKRDEIATNKVKITTLEEAEDKLRKNFSDGTYIQYKKSDLYKIKLLYHGNSPHFLQQGY